MIKHRIRKSSAGRVTNAAILGSRYVGRRCINFSGRCSSIVAGVTPLAQNCLAGMVNKYVEKTDAVRSYVRSRMTCTAIGSCIRVTRCY